MNDTIQYPENWSFTNIDTTSSKPKPKLSNFQSAVWDPRVGNYVVINLDLQKCKTVLKMRVKSTRYSDLAKGAAIEGLVIKSLPTDLAFFGLLTSKLVVLENNLAEDVDLKVGGVFVKCNKETLLKFISTIHTYTQNIFDKEKELLEKIEALSSVEECEDFLKSLA